MKHHNLSPDVERARRDVIATRAKKMHKSKAMSAAMKRRWAQKRDELAPPPEAEDEAIEVATGDTLLDGLPESV